MLSISMLRLLIAATAAAAMRPYSSSTTGKQTYGKCIWSIWLWYVYLTYICGISTLLSWLIRREGKTRNNTTHDEAQQSAHLFVSTTRGEVLKKMKSHTIDKDCKIIANSNVLDIMLNDIEESKFWWIIQIIFLIIIIIYYFIIFME